MTLKNRKLYIGTIVTALALFGLSGLTQVDALGVTPAYYRYDTCEKPFGDNMKYPVKAMLKVKKTDMEFRSYTFEQDNQNLPVFMLTYSFPETISKPVKVGFGFLTEYDCKVSEELDHIEISMIISDKGEKKQKLCYNRGMYEGTTSSSINQTPPVDEDNPLTSKVDGFPKTNGSVILTCNSGNVTDIEIGDKFITIMNGVYKDVDTGKEKIYNLSVIDTVVD